MLVMHRKVITRKINKLGWAPRINWADKTVDSEPHITSKTARYLFVKADTSKTWNRSIRVVSLRRLFTSMIWGPQLFFGFLRLKRIIRYCSLILLNLSNRNSYPLIILFSSIRGGDIQQSCGKLNCGSQDKNPDNNWFQKRRNALQNDYVIPQ